MRIITTLLKHLLSIVPSSTGADSLALAQLPQISTYTVLVPLRDTGGQPWALERLSLSLAESGHPSAGVNGSGLRPAAMVRLGLLAWSSNPSTFSI